MELQKCSKTELTVPARNMTKLMICNHSVKSSMNLVMQNLVDAVDQTCQWSNSESLDLLDYTVMASSVRLIESSDRSTASGRFCAERLETTSFSPTLYISHYLRPFEAREQPYIIWKPLLSLLSLFWAYIFLIS